MLHKCTALELTGLLLGDPALYVIIPLVSEGKSEQVVGSVINACVGCEIGVYKVGEM